MQFAWQKWNLGGKLIFVAACVATVSMFMKWIDVGFASRSGWSYGAFLFLGFWIYPVLMLLKNKEINRIGGLVCSIGSAVVTLLFILSQSEEFFGKTVNVTGTGAYIFLLASIALLVGVIKYEPFAFYEDEARQNASAKG